MSSKLGCYLISVFIVTIQSNYNLLCTTHDCCHCYIINSLQDALCLAQSIFGRNPISLTVVASKFASWPLFLLYLVVPFLTASRLFLLAYHIIFVERTFTNQLTMLNVQLTTLLENNSEQLSEYNQQSINQSMLSKQWIINPS